ncbi:PTS sugar transporter subunit IIA [Enterococcus olivae]
MELKIFDTNNIILEADIRDKIEAIVTAGKILVENGYVAEEYIDSMLERENTVSTYVGNFLAIPHGSDGSSQYIKHSGISFIQLKNEVNFGSESDPKPVKILFGISGIEDEHLNILSKIAIFASEIENVELLAKVTNKEDVIKLLDEVNV